MRLTLDLTVRFEQAEPSAKQGSHPILTLLLPATAWFAGFGTAGQRGNVAKAFPHGGQRF
jgi:hypothetical protein